MLSKLTFSLALVLMLALIAGPAFAQAVDVPAAAIEFGADPGTNAFLVMSKSNVLGTNGIVGTSDASLPTQFDLEALLKFGGTIELSVAVGASGSNDHTIKSDGATIAEFSADARAKLKHRLIISEVMWGTTAIGADGTLTQWVEIYNNGAAVEETNDGVALQFFTGKMDRIGELKTVGTATHIVVDRVSTVNRFNQLWPPKGSSGRHIRDENLGLPAEVLVSMYRKVDLDGDKYKVENGALKGLGDGAESGSWEASAGRFSMTGNFIGTPGYPHRLPGGVSVNFSKNPGSIDATGVIINEVHNDTSDANLDWVELYHFNDAAGATPQNINNWTLSMVTATQNDDGTYKDFADMNLFSLPAFKLPPNSYLVVYNRHPGETGLAGGVNIDDVLAGKQVNKGSTHLYVVREGLNLPSDKKFTLILRNGNDKAGTHEKIEDYAGNGFFKRVEALKFNTDFWPLIAWGAPGDLEGFGANTFTAGMGTWGRITEPDSMGRNRPKSRADNRTHKDDWMDFGFVGAGYDREVDQNASPGTPGYENRSVNVISDDRDTTAGADDYAFGGSVTISEIMYDAGPRWNQVQWIELYNSSQMETIDLSGWVMEIRNKEDVESYVDSSFAFDAGTTILPNQTLLLVSRTGANNIPRNRVYDLNQRHRRDLGLNARASVLLSRTGFYLSLSAKIKVAGADLLQVVDTAGNVMVEGAKRTVMWELPERGDIRQSLVRQYGSRVISDGSRDAASDGTMPSGWMQSDAPQFSDSYYGQRNDVATPGYRLGGPLPVSLSSFRPVRDKATGSVVIRWVTQSELNNAGFNILRAETADGEFKVVNLKGLIPGHGTTSEKHVYEWEDTTAKPNVVYYYQIEDVSLDGKRTTLQTTHLRGNVTATGKLTTTWGDLKTQN